MAERNGLQRRLAEAEAARDLAETRLKAANQKLRQVREWNVSGRFESLTQILNETETP